MGIPGGNRKLSGRVNEDEEKKSYVFIIKNISKT